MIMFRKFTGVSRQGFCSGGMALSCFTPMKKMASPLPHQFPARTRVSITKLTARTFSTKPPGSLHIKVSPRLLFWMITLLISTFRTWL